MLRLKELRLKENMTQEELGKIINVSGQTILNWENGIHDPSIENLKALANHFNVSIDYLVGYKNNKALTNEIINKLKDYEKDQLLKLIEFSIDEILENNKNN